MPSPNRNFLSLLDLTTPELAGLVQSAIGLKREWHARRSAPSLRGYVLALLFEKPSLRTRISFEAAMAHLGGSSTYLGADVGWGQRESVGDFARTLSRYVDAIVYRGSSQQSLEELAHASTCPVINGLTRTSHPCQALADLVTIQERWGRLSDLQAAFVGDGNNVAASFAAACAHFRIPLRMASPAGYSLPDPLVRRLRQEYRDWQFAATTDPSLAVRGANVIYTDVWTSMGDEPQREQRLREFAPFQVNSQLMGLADSRAVFLHCLPAHRGEEVTDDVIDSDQSAVFDQAENRLHAHKAILLWLLQDRAEKTMA